MICPAGPTGLVSREEQLLLVDGASDDSPSITQEQVHKLTRERQKQSRGVAGFGSHKQSTKAAGSSRTCKKVVTMSPEMSPEGPRQLLSLSLASEGTSGSQT